MSQKTVARKYVLEGRVQGVGCRAQVYDAVTSNFSDLTGSVRNLADGRVEVCLVGEAGRVAAMEAVLRTGLRPPVRVDSVLVEDLAVESNADAASATAAASAVAVAGPHSEPRQRSGSEPGQRSAPGFKILP